MKYSVIIPVFNAEKYLLTAVESVLHQPADIEIVLVDDGSTDASGQICDRLARQFANILVYHTQNQGAGAARNIGIRKATGDFILFLDADDFLDQDFFRYRSCLEKQSNCDVILYQTVKLFHNHTQEAMHEGFTSENIQGKSKQAVLEYITTMHKFPASCSGKVLRRKFLLEKAVYFPAGQLAEDVDFTLQLLLKADRFGYYDEGKYMYRLFPNSRSGKGNAKTVADLLAILEKWIVIGQNSPYEGIVLCYLAYEYAMVFPFLGALSKEKRRVFLSKMQDLQFLMTYGKTRKLKAIRRVVQFLGIDSTAKLLYTYINFRDSK